MSFESLACNMCMFPHSHKAKIQKSLGYINYLALGHLSGKLLIGTFRDRQSEMFMRNLNNWKVRKWKTEVCIILQYQQLI